MSGTTPPRLPGAPRADEFRCVSCGSKQHTVRECPAPMVPKSERPCLKCGEKGNFGSRCTKTAAQMVAPAPADQGDDVPVFSLSVDWTPVRRGAKQGVAPQRQAVTVGDFVHHNTFEALEQTENTRAKLSQNWPITAL